MSETRENGILREGSIVKTDRGCGDAWERKEGRKEGRKFRMDCRLWRGLRSAIRIYAASYAASLPTPTAPFKAGALFSASFPFTQKNIYYTSRGNLEILTLPRTLVMMIYGALRFRKHETSADFQRESTFSR